MAHTIIEKWIFMLKMVKSTIQSRKNQSLESYSVHILSNLGIPELSFGIPGIPGPDYRIHTGSGIEIKISNQNTKISKHENHKVFSKQWQKLFWNEIFLFLKNYPCFQNNNSCFEIWKFVFKKISIFLKLKFCFKKIY